MRYAFFIIMLLMAGIPHTGYSQTTSIEELGFDEFLDQVLRYHPMALQADLVTEVGRARLRMARGGFDPVVEGGYEVKEFDDKLYYDRRKAMFKVPTWFGLTLQGGVESRDGIFLNPDETMPEDGLYSAGVALDLSRGFWMDERMATLKKARILRQQSRAERQLQLNSLIENAVKAYNAWSRAYLDLQVYEQYLQASETTLDGVRKRADMGDLARIDTLEGRLAYESRMLGRSEARYKLRKAQLELSSYIWVEDQTPVELRINVIPEGSDASHVQEILALLAGIPDSLDLSQHPKMKVLDYKVEGLQVEKQQKLGMLLPDIELQYNFLSEDRAFPGAFDSSAYKAGLQFKLPLFLRKERGALQLAKAKLDYAKFERMNSGVVLRNKIIAAQEQRQALQEQVALAKEIVNDYESLLNAERRKFSLGESSLFLLISRENAALKATLTYNQLRYALWDASVELYGLYGLVPGE